MLVATYIIEYTKTLENSTLTLRCAAKIQN